MYTMMDLSPSAFLMLCVRAENCRAQRGRGCVGIYTRERGREGWTAVLAFLAA